MAGKRQGRRHYKLCNAYKQLPTNKQQLNPENQSNDEYGKTGKTWDLILDREVNQLSATKWLNERIEMKQNQIKAIEIYFTLPPALTCQVAVTMTRISSEL